MATKPKPAKQERDGGASDVVSEARVRFERAQTLLSANRRQAIEDTKFALGDSDNKWQWPADIAEGRRTDKSPCLTVNVTAQHCNQIINNIRQNRPQCKVSPADSKADKKTAEILGGLLRNIQVSSNADVAHDNAAEHAIYGGEGYWRILTEFESPTSFNQVIVIKPIENPQLVYVDPFCGMDRLKAQWGFVFEDITKEQCKRDFPDVEPASWENDGIRGWVSADTVRIADYFYCTNVPDTLYMLPDGSSILESEALAKGGAEAVEMVKLQAKMLAEQAGGKTSRPTATPKWKYCKLIGGHDKPVDEKDWPGNYLPIISVIGKEINVNGEIIRKGVVRDLKDPARIVNYSFSGAVETIALQNKIPYVAAAEAIEGYEADWEGANQSKKSVLLYNAFDENGTAIPKPERQQASVMPTAQVQMLQLSTEQMRAASGQQNSNFGIKSEASSGIGIQRLKVQGETATFHFPDNVARALHDEAVVVIDLVPRVMDTRQIVRALGIDGKESQVVLDPDLQGAHAEITEGDIKEVFNPTVGRYDVVIDTGPSYQTQRQEAAAALTELAGKNPALMQIAGDIIMKSYDFPFSEQLAERIKKTIDPKLLEDGKQPQIPPQVQQKMQGMEQQIQQMGEALENAGRITDKLEDEAKSRKAEEAKLEIDAYAKITERLKLVAAILPPGLAQALMLGTVQQALQQADPLPDELVSGMPMQMPGGPEQGGMMPEMMGQGMPPEMPPDQMMQQQQQPAPDAGFFTPGQG